MAARAGEPVGDGTVRIPLTRGYFAVVDEADYEIVRPFNWCARLHRDGYVYAMRTARASETGPVTVQMHRQIMGAAPGVYVDHRSGNRLDNTRNNLRICTPAQNQYNRRRVSAISGFKGVRRGHGDKWAAFISFENRPRYLGLFDTREQAARSYDVAATELYGEFAATNESLGLFERNSVQP